MVCVCLEGAIVTEDLIDSAGPAGRPGMAGGFCACGESHDGKIRSVRGVFWFSAGTTERLRARLQDRPGA